jgi:hypothetical protein
MALPHGMITDFRNGSWDCRDYLRMPLKRTVEWPFIADYVNKAIRHLFKLDTNDLGICGDAKLFYHIVALTIHHLRKTGRCCKMSKLNWPRLLENS